MGCCCCEGKDDEELGQGGGSWICRARMFMTAEEDETIAEEGKEPAM